MNVETMCSVHSTMMLHSDSVGVLAVFQIRMDPHSFCRALRDEFVSASGFDLKPVLIN